MSEKFSQYKEYLKNTYGPRMFVSKDWLKRKLAAQAPVRELEPVPVSELTPQSQASQAPETLEMIRQDLGNCTRCQLHEKRTHLVFGEGNPNADLMFIGEGPGEQEDLNARPFVGKAGQLLDKIIEAMGLKRTDVYIANVVKCRPPGNRTPQPDEVSTCEPFLFRQIDVIKPKVIVALGGTALQCLLHTDAKITRMRGRFTEYRGTKLMPTYHPAFLLRNPDAKKDVWEDMKTVMAELGIKK